MKMIQPNCRVQFAAEDIEFIVSVLGHKTGDMDCLVKLLTDEETRDLILDDEELFRALLERRGCLRVSTHFYFYVMVRQVFSHLLANAIKFTSRRSGAEIAVTGATEGEWNTYCVADNGVGFDQRYAHKLFGVFQRLHRPEDFEGTGVGLAVVQRIVQRHGGRTWAEGEVNGGARFYFTLPNAGEIHP